MVISGGDHLEWPEEDYFRQYHGGNGYDGEYDDLREEKWTMELNQEYEDWLWEQVLENGPPQSDGLWWVKWYAYTKGVEYARDFVRDGYKVPPAYQTRREAMDRLGAL